ncbi:CC/Se motif family (seleno)protein [Halomonas vilamensis]|uniref:CC/Se motif family (Seleno)protein n=1 Tax=Vreelandella vilamensis TaxID=531309 RepID=A0ABU1H361_9GAMM|nr:CC/Se motif family (seleno)protein [Halomonas vilamensis]MDR5898540.1 CC/Se motif family (seleno)protein [Halomonas vilamensis]
MAEPIHISPDAAAFIHEKGGVLTVRLSPRHGCCGGIASLAVAEARPPNAPEHFTRDERDGLTLYIAPELEEEGLKVDVEGFWKLRRLYVDGAAIHSPRSESS